MIVLVLGSTGFAGRNAVQYFRQHGYETIGIARADCDLLNLTSTQKFFSKFISSEVSIVNCAVVNKNIMNSYDSFIQNVSIVRNILDSISTLNVGVFIQFSSFDVYGSNIHSIITESSTTKAEDWYGLSKITTENMLDMYPSLKQKTCVLRIPGIYSLDSDDTTSIISRFKQKILLGEEIQLSNAGNTLRDYVHVSDLLNFINLIIKKKKGYDVFNVGSGTSLTLKQIIHLLAQTYKVIPKISYCNDYNRTFDIVIDCVKIKEYFPEIEINSLEWHLKNNTL